MVDKEIKEPKKHEKSEDNKEQEQPRDFVQVVTQGLNRVMRDRTALRGVEKEFDAAVSDLIGKETESLTKLRQDLRQQLQTGRLALESLESRLMSIITG